MIMLMYTIEMIVLMFVVTVSIALLAIFFIMKKSKKNITIKIISVLTILVLTWIGGILWMWGPLPGYTQEFKKSGNPLTNYELIGYKNEKFHGAGGGISPSVRNVTSCMKQQDFDADINYLGSIEIIETYSYEIPEKESKSCELINMTKFKGNLTIISGFNYYKLSNLGKEKGITILLNNTQNTVVDFENSELENIVISESLDYRGSFKFKLNGIENIKNITIENAKGEWYEYDIESGELESFLMDWGYLDEEGYNGKKYVYSEEKLKKTKF